MTCHTCISTCSRAHLPRYIVSSFEATSSHLYPRAFLSSALMFVLEEPKSRKRPRSSHEPVDLEPEPIAKKQKSLSQSRDLPRHRPPSYWDTLSRRRLSRGALREFDRRNIQEKELGAHEQKALAIDDCRFVEFHLPRYQQCHSHQQNQGRRLPRHDVDGLLRIWY